MNRFTEADDRTLREMAGAVEVQILHRKLEVLKALPSDELAELKAQLASELERRRPEPPAPPPTVIEGWSIVAVAPSANRGLWDIEVTDGEHVFRFEACSDGGTQAPLAWAVEQVRAMDLVSFAINCRHCPDQGEPTRPTAWDEEGD